MVLGACNTGKKDSSSTNSVAMNQTSTETPMVKQSRATVEVATQYMDAMGKGDMETMVRLMDEEMVWQNEGDKSLP